MIPLLGMACVVWTAYEISRLAQRPVLTGEDADSDPRSPRPRRRRFAAWDDLGRPIDVGDLGQA